MSSAARKVQQGLSGHTSFAAVVALGGVLLAGHFVLLPSISQKAAVAPGRQRGEERSLATVVLPDAVTGASLERKEKQAWSLGMPLETEAPRFRDTLHQPSRDLSRRPDEIFIDLWLDEAHAEAQAMQLFQGNRWSETEPKLVNRRQVDLEEAWLDDADAEAESMQLFEGRSNSGTELSAQPLSPGGQAASEEVGRQEDSASASNFWERATAALAACCMLFVVSLHSLHTPMPLLRHLHPLAAYRFAEATVVVALASAVVVVMLYGCSLMAFEGVSLFREGVSWLKSLS